MKLLVGKQNLHAALLFRTPQPHLKLLQLGTTLLESCVCLWGDELVVESSAAQTLLSDASL